MLLFLIQATIYLGAAILAVPFATRFGLGSVLGYLAAGILIGPILGLIGNEAEEVRHFAEFGVVMMLFLIGLDLEPRALWDMRRRLFGLGGLQIALTVAVIAGIAAALGLGWAQAIGLGLIFSLSSTAIVLQTLTEKRLMQSEGGRASFSVLLAQDLAVIPMLAILPLLAQAAGNRRAGVSDEHQLDARAEGVERHAAEAMNLVESLPGWAITLVTLGAVVAVVLAGIYLTRPLFRYIHHTRLSEMHTALALFMVVSIAALMNLVGLSAALGTFLAGVVLANSEFRHELESDLEPFKGLLHGLFFITVGAGINMHTLVDAPVLILGSALGVIAVKFAILELLARLSPMSGRARQLFSLSLAQAGEFGFVLASFAITLKLFDAELAERVLVVIALSMLATPLLFILYDRLPQHRADAAPRERDDIDEDGPVIIAGIGRFGQVVNRLVRSAGFRTVVLDASMETIDTMRRFGVKSYFGDPSRPEVLRAAGLDEARVLVVSVDDRKAALKLVSYARAQRPDLHIIARAFDRVHVYELYKAGADEIVRELFDSSLRAGRYVLEELGLSDFEATEAEMAFYHRDRAMVRELAELWRPGVPVSENADYVKRARELNSDLETALMNDLAKRAEQDGESDRADGYRPKPRDV